MPGPPYIKPPTDFEFSVLKWVILLVVIPSLFFSCVSITSKHSQCKQACVEKLFYESRYARGDGCYCLTEDESRIKNRIPTGAKIY